MSQPMRFLVSGPGLIGKNHARLIQANPDCRLTALVGPPTPENLAFAQNCSVALHDGLEEAFAAGHYDAAIISSPNTCHFAQAMACIERGIPTLVEKPITDRLDEARTLTLASEQTGVPVLVGHHRTYSPLLQTAQRFLSSERFGRLVAVQGAALFYKPAHYFAEGPWRTCKGGGPVLINLIHEIGLMQFLGGRITRVFAAASSSIRQHEVEDTVAITLEFASGALGTFILSDAAASNKSWEMTSGENPAYPHFTDQTCYHFAGTGGSLDFPTMVARYYPTAEAASWWKPFETETIGFSPQDPLALQLGHFVDVVRGKAPPRVSARDGYMNLLVVESILQSMTTMRPVDILVELA